MLRPTPVYTPIMRGQPALNRSYLHHSMVHEQPYYYPSPLARLHNVSMDSSACSLYSMPSTGRYMHPPTSNGLHSANSSVRQKFIPRGQSYLDEGVRRIYANSSISHSLYPDGDGDVDDDASILLSTNVDNNDTQDAANEYEHEDALEEERYGAPALCLTPRFLASKRRHNDRDDVTDDVAVQSTDSLDQILEEGDCSLLRGSRQTASGDEVRESVKNRRGTRKRIVNEVKKSDSGYNDEFEKFVSNKQESPMKINSDTERNESHARTNDAVVKKKEYQLVDWTIRPVETIKRVFVEGMRHEGGEKVLWRSTAIKKVLDKRTLQTGSGSVYKLIGPMNIDDAEALGFSASFCKAFKNGFPKNWSELVQKHFLSLEKDDDENSQSRNVTRTRVNETVTNGVKAKPKARSRSIQQELWNGPTPGTKFDLSTCERTRSGRVVVPSKAVAWWKGVRIYTTPKTPLEIRVDTPIENQLDSPLAYPLSATKYGRFKTPNRSLIKKTASDDSLVKSSKFRTPKLTPRSKLDKSKVGELITKAEKPRKGSVTSEQSESENEKVNSNKSKSKSTDSDSTVNSEKPKRKPVRKVAKKGSKNAAKPSLSVVEIPDTIQKPKSPIRESLVRSPYSYPAHRTRNRSRSDGSNDKFRKLFDDVTDSEHSAKSRSDSELKKSKVNFENESGNDTDRNTSRRSRTTNRSGPKVAAPVSAKSSKNPEGVSDDVVPKRQTGNRSRDKVGEDNSIDPHVVLRDIASKNSKIRSSGNSGEKERSASEDSEIVPKGRKLRGRAAKPLPPESEVDSVSSSRRGRRKKSESESRNDGGKIKTAVVETSVTVQPEGRKMRARKTKSVVQSEESTNDSEYVPIPTKSRSQKTKSKPETKRRSRSRQISESESSTQAKKVPAKNVTSKATEIEHEDSDTDDEIFAARNRIKEKQDETNKTINRSLGLNRSAKSRQKKNDSFSVSTVNELGEKETLTWSEDEVQRFRKALSSIPASTENYWHEVANLTESKTADQCRAFHLRDVPNSVKKIVKPQPKPVVPVLIRDESANTLRVEVSGGKGTFKRKRNMQTLLNHMNEDFENDYFNSTPWCRKQRRIDLPLDESETPLPKYTSVNTPATRLALMPRSERKTPVSSFISPGTSHDSEKDDLYIHRCVQQMRRKGGGLKKVPRNHQTPKSQVSKEKNLQGGTKILMELSQNDIDDEGEVDSEEEQDDYFSDEDKN